MKLQFVFTIRLWSIYCHRSSYGHSFVQTGFSASSETTFNPVIDILFRPTILWQSGQRTSNWELKSPFTLYYCFERLTTLILTDFPVWCCAKSLKRSSLRTHNLYSGETDQVLDLQWWIWSEFLQNIPPAKVSQIQTTGWILSLLLVEGL